MTSRHMRDYMAGRITSAEYVQRVKDDVNAGRGIYGISGRAPKKRSWLRRLLGGGGAK